MQHVERELTEYVKLCDARGQLNPKAIGYAKQPLVESNLSGNFMRKKKWNYWCVFGDEILFSATISHLDYATVCFVYFLNYETQRFYEKMTKIHEDVLFHYDKEDYKKPWLIHSKFSDDVKLTFSPFFERVSKTDVRLIKSEVHQLFGYYNGYVRYPDGKKLKITQLLGSIEEHYAKW